MKKGPRKDEVLCVDQFQDWLKEHDPKANISDFIFEPNGRDTAPDYELRIDANVYYVEATIVTNKEKASLSHRSQSFISDLNKRIKNIDGGYELIAERSVDNFQSQRNLIEAQVLKYIEETQALSKYPFRQIMLDGKCCFVIHKVGSQPNKLFSSGPDSAAWEADAEIELFALLSTALATKKKLLGNISGRKILILLDEYLLAREEHWQKAVDQLNSQAFFHSIFLAQNPSVGSGFMLTSEIANWC